MRKLILTGVVLTVAAIYVSLPNSEASVSSNSVAMQKLQGELDQDEAIKMAQQHASKTNVDPSRYAASGCKVRFGWRVYLEPIGGLPETDVLEYLLTTKGGMVVATNKLSGRKHDDPTNAGQQLPATIGEEDAIAIAGKDATRAGNLKNKQLTVCELKGFWRIIYAPPMPLNGGGPEYLIDKKTGLITDKKYYQ